MKKKKREKSNNTDVYNYRLNDLDLHLHQNGIAPLFNLPKYDFHILQLFFATPPPHTQTTFDVVWIELRDLSEPISPTQIQNKIKIKNNNIVINP